MRDKQAIILFSIESFDEFESRLGRPKFDRYLDRGERSVHVALARRLADWVEVKGESFGCRDPKDDVILETALVGGADAIVTGDKDLLVMHPFRGIPILTPADFLARIGDASP